MVVLLDSTLREGELFVVLPLPKKLKVAELIAETGVKKAEVTVDYPPKTHKEDVEPLVKAFKERGVETVMHGRAYSQDVEAMAKYDIDGVAVYMAASQLHLDHKLKGMSREEAMSRLAEAVSMAAAHGYKYVRATLEDASRLYVEGQLEALDELLSFTRELKSAGATLVSIPDTAGLMSPNQASEFFSYAVKRSSLPLACHFHNDYGYASANTVSAILAGAEEAHVTLLGIGDRNGIADLYEVASLLHDVHGMDLGINRSSLNRVYHEFARLAGIKIPWRHPLSDEARTVRAGVHQSLTLRRPEGYVPSGKMTNDFDSLKYSATPYLSHKVVVEIARASGVEITEQQAKQAVETIASLYQARGRPPSLQELAKVLSEALKAEVKEDPLARFFGEEKVYVLVKLNPHFPVSELLKEVTKWDDVESVDEVYGDVDLVIIGKLRIGPDNLVERLKDFLGPNAERVNVLITD